MSNFVLMKTCTEPCMNPYKIISVDSTDKPYIFAANKFPSQVGQHLTHDFEATYTKLGFEIKPIKLLTNNRTSIDVFVTEDNKYFLVYNGRIRHADCDVATATDLLHDYFKCEVIENHS